VHQGTRRQIVPVWTPFGKVDHGAERAPSGGSNRGQVAAPPGSHTLPIMIFVPKASK
jgi:hypothetical protein